jgi:hypothetical protein
MADKSFGVKDINLIGASGTPEIESPNNLNIKAVNVAISTDMSVGGELTVTDTFLKPQAVGLGTTNATGRDAGISTATGTVIYDPVVGMQVYAGTGWKTISNTAADVDSGGMTASGGNSNFIAAGKTVQKFTSDGTFTVSSGSGTVEIFAVGGGGSGGCDGGGGGGGGAAIWVTAVPVNPGTYTIVCGPGGTTGTPYLATSTPDTDHGSNYNGDPSSFAHPDGNYVAHGGNAGGVTHPNPYGLSPVSDGRINNCLGCPGGAHTGSPNSGAVANAGLYNPYPVPSTGTTNVFRNEGGSVNTPHAPWTGAGGGGAGGVGSDTTNNAGAGGAGYDAGSNIPWMPNTEGVSGIFGGGGGAGSPDGGNAGGGAGGPGGGGSGSPEGGNSGGNGTSSCGAGGGGADGAPNQAGAGSRGVVFVAYTPE